jgi:hypothetical protein
MSDEKNPLCLCGCGHRVNRPGQRFFKAGHYFRWLNTTRTPEERSKYASNAARALNDQPDRAEHLKYARSCRTEEGVQNFVKAGQDRLKELRKDEEWTIQRNAKISAGMLKKATPEERSSRGRKGYDALVSDPKKLDGWIHSMMFGENYTGTRYVYKDIKFRSRYEVRFAFVLDQLGFDWDYEPVYLPYYKGSKRHHYIPDFYIHDLGTNVFFEVIGYFPEKKLKKLLNVSQFNNSCVCLIDKDILDNMGLNNKRIKFSRDKDNKKLFHANTEPSQVGNSLEGVETTIEHLRTYFVSMISKLHEQSHIHDNFVCVRYSPSLREIAGPKDKELLDVQVFRINSVVYAPYIPLMATPTLVTSDLYAQKGFLSAAGFKLINAGMYTYGDINNLGTTV